MKTLTISSATGLILVLGVANSGVAQEGPPNFVPVEMTGCTYKGGNDRGDADSAYNRMIRWMNDNDALPYAAWHLEKLFTGPDRDFDYLYIGAWPDGGVMGRDIAQYRATAGAAIEAAEAVADCPANLLFASLEVKAPPEGDTSRDGVVITMSDCTVSEHRTVVDAITAMREYGEYRSETGSPGGMWLWFPAYGDGGVEGNFKLVSSHSDLAAFGDHYKWIVDNAAYRKQRELMEGLVDCDTARAYVGDSIVNTIATE